MTYSMREKSSTQTVDLASLAQLCSQLFDEYHCQHPDEIAQVRLDALESQ
jgi:hypothetical protein